MQLIKAKDILYNKDGIIGVNLNREGKTENIPDIFFRFSSFYRPNNLDKNALNIVLDNSFDFYEDDNIIFIDHHISEELNKCGYKSNSSMMVKYYRMIFEYFTAIFENYRYDDIVLHMHHDIDGLCSGIICLKILKDVLNKKYDNNYEDNLKFLEILGNYGDIDPDAKIGLTNYFTTKDIDIFDKKIKQYCSSLGKFFKATRAVYPDPENLSNDDFIPSEAYLKLKDILAENNLDVKMINNILNEIYYNLHKFWKDRTVNFANTLMFFNTLGQNRILNLILEIYNKEIDRLVNNYINPTTPSFEMSIKFIKDKTNTVFKLLIIDSPFDCGRSVIWKYRSSLKYFINTNKENKWKFNIADWNKNLDLISLSKNVICYNRTLNKLSFDGDNSAAYDIANTVFNGGGHPDLEEGRSLGSAVIDDEQLFFDSFIILDIF